MKFHIITLFPSLFSGFIEDSLIGKARQSNLIDLHLIDLRKFGIGDRKTVDDKPFGGGCGMLLKPEPIISALESFSIGDSSRKILLSAGGETFNQSKSFEYSQLDEIVLICGRYEGVDHRVSHFIDEEISIGNFVLMGGEVAAMAVVEATSRHINGVLGNQESTIVESHSTIFPVEFDQYTKPRSFRGIDVPQELLNGDHKKIELWRKENSKNRQKCKHDNIT